MRTDFIALTIVRVAGELDLATGPRLRRELLLAADRAQRLLIVDLRDLTFIDAAGIRVLLTGARRMAECSGRLTLACPQEGVRRVLEMTDLDRYLGVHDSIADAVRVHEPLLEPIVGEEP